MPREHLIDVRSPTEYTLGHLTSDLSPTLNIEYTSIASLASVFSAQNIPLAKDDNITLYCRSGRRSDIARKKLLEMGYSSVRDIGGWDDARRTLDREVVARQLEGLVGEDGEAGKNEGEVKGGDGKEGKRKADLSALLKGLEECDG